MEKSPSKLVRKRIFDPGSNPKLTLTLTLNQALGLGLGLGLGLATGRTISVENRKPKAKDAYRQRLLERIFKTC